jgi:hypothetical protein
MRGARIAVGERAHEPTHRLIAEAALLAFVARIVAEHFQSPAFGSAMVATKCKQGD